MYNSIFPLTRYRARSFPVVVNLPPSRLLALRTSISPGPSPSQDTDGSLLELIDLIRTRRPQEPDPVGIPSLVPLPIHTAHLQFL